MSLSLIFSQFLFNVGSPFGSIGSEQELSQIVALNHHLQLHHVVHCTYPIFFVLFDRNKLFLIFPFFSGIYTYYNQVTSFIKLHSRYYFIHIIIIFNSVFLFFLSTYMATPLPLTLSYISPKTLHNSQQKQILVIFILFLLLLLYFHFSL